MSELELLERVFLRLGCADTDEQLQVTINKFLPPVLEKITSPTEAVRLKVMEILTHINKRLKARPMILVPLEPILDLYRNSDSSFVMNFSIIYITMGFPRLTLDQQAEMATLIISAISGKPEIHQDKLLTLIVPLMGFIKIPDDPLQRHKLLGLAGSDTSGAKPQLLAIFQDILLFPYGVTHEVDIPLGMSSYSFKRVIINNWKADELEEHKKGLVRFLGSGVFPDEDVLLPLIVASADTRFSVATPALAELNKICSSINWENGKLTEPLYILFSGNGHKNKEKKTKPTNVRVRQKLLQYLLKSRRSGIHEVRGLQVVFEALFGEQTNQKCKVAALQFCEIMIRDGEISMIRKLAKVLFDGINKLLMDCKEPYDVQVAAYGALSQLLITCPELIHKDLELVSKYFKALVDAPVEIQEGIKDLLQAIAPAFNHQDNDKVTETLLLALLTEFVVTKINIVKKVLIIYLTTCFPEFFVPARYLLLLLLEGEDKSSLRELIILSLYGHTKKDHVDPKQLISASLVSSLKPDHWTGKILPDFSEMSNYCYEQAEKRRNKFGSSDNLVYSVEIYEEILYYLRVCLWTSAELKTIPANSGIGCHQLKEYVLINSEKSGFINYVTFIKGLLVKSRGFIPLSCLFDICNSLPQLITLDKLDTNLIALLEAGLKDVTEDTRTVIAQLYGLILAHSSSQMDFLSKVKALFHAQNKSLEHRHGAILAGAYTFKKRIEILVHEKKWAPQNKSNDSYWSSLQDVVNHLMGALTDSQPLIVSGAVLGLSFISQVTSLPLKESSNMELEEDDQSTAITMNYSKQDILDSLFKLLISSGTKQKLKEEACDCLASLTFTDPDFYRLTILKKFLQLNKMTKDAAIHIAIGQCIIKMLLGVSEITDIFDDDGNVKNSKEKVNSFPDEYLDWLLLELASVINSDLHPHSRQAVCIWLLGIVKSCNNRDPVRNRRDILQLTFTELLSENNELVQDAASRGLGELYSLSSDIDQSTLANSLLDQLTGSKPHVMKVTADTKLFEEGALGKTPTGDHISTYKELCNLASDLNQPDLIYQFMQLANHNATWNNRLGAAFGLKSISRLARVNMAPYLIKIVPRLYRYKYDPTPKVQHSMTAIWDSIVTNNKETVDLYYWDILVDINKNLTSPEWRTRMSCCLAVRDLLKNGIRIRNAQDGNAIQTENDLLELWKQLFRVMDDVHEGTRLAAEGTATGLSKLCVAATNSDHGKSGRIIAHTILPFILQDGITHVVPEVRRLSIKLVSEMIETGGANAIGPHLAQLVPCLLQATGELEGSKLNYISTRYGAQENLQEAIDSIRAESAKQYHTMQTLSKCIPFIDYPLLEEMTPSVLDLMRSSVNLGTKVACAQFLCLMSIRLGNELQPLTAKYINACCNGLSDRNLIVRKHYASSIGHLLGVAKDDRVVKVMQKMQEFYEDRQSNRSTAVPLVIQSINKRYPELLKDNYGLVLPLIFFAMHEEVGKDDYKEMVELWTDLWHDISPGEAGIRMNLDTIVPKLVRFLDDSSWNLKIQAANAIKSLAKKLEKTLSSPQRILLIDKLLLSIPGRSYVGKERLLQALAELCQHFDIDDNSSEIITRIVDCIMRECRKEEPIYRTHSLQALGDILNALRVDRFEEVYNMVWHLLDRGSSPETSIGMSEDDGYTQTAEERTEKMVRNIQLRQTVCETLGKAWPRNATNTQKKYQLKFVDKCVECLTRNTRPVQLSLLIALSRFLERLKIFDNDTDSAMELDEESEKRFKIDCAEMDNGEDLEKICSSVLKCVEDISTVPHTGLKKEALNIILVLIKKLMNRNNSEQHLILVRNKFGSLVEIFHKDNAPEVKCRLLDIESHLKKLN